MSDLQSAPSSAIEEGNQESSEKTRGLLHLVDLSGATNSGSVCIAIRSISTPSTSRSGWKYRKMDVKDTTMEAEMLISEAKFEEWKFKSGDYIVCDVRSNGINGEGKLTVFFNSFLGPFEVSKLLYEMTESLRKLATAKGSQMSRPRRYIKSLRERQCHLWS